MPIHNHQRGIVDYAESASLGLSPFGVKVVGCDAKLLGHLAFDLTHGELDFPAACSFGCVEDNNLQGSSPWRRWLRGRLCRKSGLSRRSVDSPYLLIYVATASAEEYEPKHPYNDVYLSHLTTFPFAPQELESVSLSPFVD